MEWLTTIAQWGGVILLIAIVFALVLFYTEVVPYNILDSDKTEGEYKGEEDNDR